MVSLPKKILRKNRRKKLKIGPLKKIFLPETKSQIVLKNQNTLYAWIFSGLEGLFRKDGFATALYGRKLCDEVKMRYQCGGFFTSDELPRYGLSRRETKKIFAQMEKKEGDLIIFCAYNKLLSQKIRLFLTFHLRKELLI